jgi:predicted nucleic acid-binding protein
MRFVDSNVFVYHLAGDIRYGDQSTRILSSIEKGEETVTSTLVMIQVCSYLKWKKREDVIPVFLNLLGKLSTLKKLETTVSDFREAAAIKTQYNMPWTMWDDVVITAQMKRQNIEEIYSNDEDFNEIPWVKRIF